MFEPNKLKITEPTKRTIVDYQEAPRKKFEVLYQNWTPYKRLGTWLQFIWKY